MTLTQRLLLSWIVNAIVLAVTAAILTKVTVDHFGDVVLAAAVFAFSGASDPSTRFTEIGHQLMCICSCGQILLECNHVG